MQILKTVDELRAWSDGVRDLEGWTGLVPTMGALHEGHLSLVRMAKGGCTNVVVSIFVNPTQFGPNEDFARYPRTFEADCALLEAEGVDAIFAPSPQEMYRQGASTFVDVEGLSERLDGKSRPGHFRGVATIVAKLLIASSADYAFFGQKDAAQVAVLRQMVTDLGLPVKLMVCPIVREPDGLAMSSRNRYLSIDERRQALALSRAIRKVEEAFRDGESHAEQLTELARTELAAESSVRVDYVALVDWGTLLPLEKATKGALFAVAAWVGETRLIDNCVL